MMDLRVLCENRAKKPGNWHKRRKNVSPIKKILLVHAVCFQHMLYIFDWKVIILVKNIEII